MSLRGVGAVLVLIAMAAGTGAIGLEAQAAQSQAPGENARRVKSKVQPVYPDLARKMNLSGTVKVEVVISPNGTVKEAKVVGGHPVLANAALEAARKWRFEAAAAESSSVLDFRFEPHQ